MMANTLAHALLGAVVAQAGGNNALAGAAGEAGGASADGGAVPWEESGRTE
ncbi:hypothetical protein QUF31_20145 [Dickeya chrysanthemi]|uniref:hypothetical protein n=1 Tax=Dickeya chrysanthemi TaxID=556 RepID=UPI0025A26944|nr:hypothetical protein [Dickeya chrysanthemi]WJM85364.1 hypothetical protein QUF31_20145 [Dickeya chrysanthemi]